MATAGVETVPLTFIGESREYLPETGDDTDPLLRNYLGYLGDHPANVAEAVRRLAAADAGPALVHCAAGKDRTGVLVALVLDVVGVERDEVVADYALSAENVEAMFRRWTTAAGEEMPADLTPHKPRAAVMDAVLAHLDAEHGGAAGWLRANGLTDDDLARLRSASRPDPRVIAAARTVRPSRGRCRTAGGDHGLRAAPRSSPRCRACAGPTARPSRRASPVAAR